MDTLHATTLEHEELGSRLSAQGVRWIAAMYPDIAGRPRGKVVPIRRLAQLAAGSERYTPRGLDGFGEMNPTEDECVTIPDLSSVWILPWDHTCAVVPSDLSQEGRPYELCCRTILKTQLERAMSMGFVCKLGVESEIYVFKGDGSDPRSPLEPLIPSGVRQPTPAYLLDAAFDAMGFLGPMVDAMDAIGCDVFSFDQEGGEGQYEFDFAHDDALVIADRLLLFRMMAKHYATAAGGFASFMPKPSVTSWGSGAHFNMSLESPEGLNLFKDELGEWTRTASSFTAGILQHGRSMAAITNPTVNSYKRLVSSLEGGGVSWAPIWVSTGDNNRSCMIRFPRNRPAIENRLVDSSANTYLAAAFMLAAGLEGIEQDLDLPEMAKGETYSWFEIEHQRELRVPRNLLEAIDVFATDPLVKKVFPYGFVDEYCTMKEREWNEYHELVSDWELSRYLTQL
jgi:glutamine synthetase